MLNSSFSEGSIAIHQDANLSFAKLDAGQKVDYTLTLERHAWVHVAEGEVDVNGTKLTGGDAIGISAESVLNISAAKASQVLLFDLN